MKINIKMEIVPFDVPDTVTIKGSPKPREQGFTEGKRLLLSELDNNTLNLLCDQFLKEVFEKARKL